ncbi:unnamed protein product [Closterium sp. Yama58-4]|nr:unnamed protein product [Closterium sp. Yama58-4]
MSWLLNSLVGSPRAGDDDDDDLDEENDDALLPVAGSSGNPDSPDSAARDAAAAAGVRDDLTELQQSLTKHWRGVASFLTGEPRWAPSASPPAASASASASATASADDAASLDPPALLSPEETAGLSRDEEDIKAISSTLATGITGVGRLASRLFAATDAQLGRAEGSGGDGERAEGAGAGMAEGEEFGEAEVAVGVTADVVQFAQNLSGHPETWIEFPLPDEEDEEEDFEVAGEQEEHIEAVEARVPRLVALRMELTPQHLSERRFWKIYFVLLHSRIPPAAAARLSTPPILRARDQVLAALRQQSAAGTAGDSPSPSPSADTAPTAAAAGGGQGTEEVKAGSALHQGEADGKKVADEAAGSSADVAAAVSSVRDEDADDDWLEEDSGGVLGGGGGGGAVGGGAGGVDDGEDVSFSDLEDEDEEGEKAKVDGSRVQAGSSEAAAAAAAAESGAGGAGDGSDDLDDDLDGDLDGELDVGDDTEGENATAVAAGEGASADGGSAVQGEQAQGPAGAADAADAAASAAQTAAAAGEAGDKDGGAEEGKEAGKGGATEVSKEGSKEGSPRDVHADVASDAPAMSDLSLWSHRLRAVSGGDAATPSLAPAPDPTNPVRTSRTDGSSPHCTALHFPDTSHPASGSQAVPFPSPRHLSAAPPAAACPIAALPADVLLHCLIRLPRADWPRLRAVCRTWRRLVACPDFLRLRRADGRNESWLFAVEWMFKGGCSGQAAGNASGGGSSGAGVWGGRGRKVGGGTARGVGGSSVDLGDSGRREWGEGGDSVSIEEAGDEGNEDWVRDENAEEAGCAGGIGSAAAREGRARAAAQNEVPPLAATAQNRTRSRVLLLQQHQQQQRTAVSTNQRARSVSLSPYTTAPAAASASLALLWAYDPAAQRWYSHGCLPPMRGICHSSTLLALGPCLLLLGGSCSSACCSPGGGVCGPSRAVWRYNVVTGKARRLADMTCPRFNFAAAVLPSSGRIIVAGGTGTTTTPTTTTTAAAASAAGTAARTGLGTGGATHSSCGSSGQAREWAVGFDEALQAAELYDPTTNRWLPLPALPHPTRSAQGLVLADESFWVVSTSSLVAGLVATRLTTADGQLVLTNHVAPMCHHVLQYLPHTNSWRDAGKLPVCGFRGFGVVGVNGRLLVEGGVEAATVDGAVGLDPGRFLQRTPYVNAFQPRMWGVQEGGRVMHERGSGRGESVRSSGGDGRGHGVRQGGDEAQRGIDGHGELAVELRAHPAMGLLGRGMAENEASRQSVSNPYEGNIGGAEGSVWESEAGQAGIRENASTNMHAPAHEQQGNGISAPGGGHGDGEGVGGAEGSAGSEVVLQEAVWRPVRPFGNAGVPRVCHWCVVSTL